MADQVNIAGSIAPGPPLALKGSGAQRVSPEITRNVKSAEVKTAKADAKMTSGPTQTPEAAMGKLNNFLEEANSEIQFEVDKGSGRTVFQIVNQNSGAVVMQVPSEEVLAMARNLRDLDKAKDPSGVLVNKEG